MSAVFSINEVYAQDRYDVHYQPGWVSIKMNSFALVRTEFMMKEN